MVKNQPANEGDVRNTGLIPGSGRSPGVGNGNPLQYSCLENSMDRGGWRTTVQGVAKESDTTEVTERAHTHTHTQHSSDFYLFLDGLQPARLLCPWDFPGKDTGVGCHFLLHGIFPEYS